MVRYYFCASNSNPGASWTEYTGYLSGSAAVGTGSARPDPTNPANLHEDATYFRPLVVVNYNGVAGITEVDFVSIEVVPAGDDLTSIDGGRIIANSITTDELSATAIDGMVITGSTIRTAASGARIEMNSTKIFGTDGSTIQWEALASTGALTAAAGDVVLDEDGVTILSPALGVGSLPTAVKWNKTATPTQNFFKVQGYTDTTYQTNVGEVTALAPASGDRGYLNLAAAGNSAVGELHLSAASGSGSAVVHMTGDNSPAEGDIHIRGSNFQGIYIYNGTVHDSTGPNAWIDVKVSANGEGVKVDNAFAGRGYHGSTYGQFSHWTYRNSSGGYGYMQSSGGAVLLSAPSGNSVYLRVNNATIMSVASTAVDIQQDLTFASTSSLGTSWTGLSFGTNWLSYGSGLQVGQYKRVGDLVLLRGLVTCTGAWATYTTIATLPAGFRPASHLVFWHPCNANDGMRVDITTAGVVTFVATNGSQTTGWVSLDELCFSID